MMKAWQLPNYKSLLQLNNLKIPYIKSPDDILVKIKAASINPIDCEMKDGYGKRSIELVRRVLTFSLQNSSPFPLILGRDFSGVVKEVGSNVKMYKPGDEVWGALGVQRQGTHAEYCVASKLSLSHKPKNINHLEAASIPYVAMTVLSSLFYFSPKFLPNIYDKNVLVRGAAGGIGTFTIQLMKALGARNIVATCNPDSSELVKSLGADEVFDYKSPTIYQMLKQMGQFDIVYDPIGGPEINNYLELLKPWSKSRYICLSTPLLSYTDNYGIIPGFAASTLNFSLKAFQALSRGSLFTYGYFAPNKEALKLVKKLVEDGMICPVLEEIVDFEKVPEAYDKVKMRRGRGKTVIHMP